MMTEMKTEMKEIKNIVQHNGTRLESFRMTGSDMTYKLPEDVVLPVRTVEDLDNLEVKITDNKELEQHLVRTYALK